VANVSAIWNLGRFHSLKITDLCGIMGRNNSFSATRILIAFFVGQRSNIQNFSGASEEPVYWVMREGRIEFRDALHFWGKDISETEDQIGAELEDPNLKRIKILGSGPVGENLFHFASPINQRYHSAVQGGAGPALGSKKMEPIVVDSKSTFPTYRRIFRKSH
jgi:hypothetical protein